MLRRCRLGWVLSAGLAAAAVQPLPAQVTITPGNSVNLDSVARPQNSSGQTTTFAVQYFASTSGIDRKFRFSCIGTNGITGVVCPLTKTLTSNAASTTIPVTFNTGAAGTGTLTVRVDQTLPSGPLTATGRRDFTITAPSASLVVLAPTAANMYRGVGATPTEAFTLKNIGPGSTTYTLAVAPGSCGGVLTGCSVSPTNVTLAPTVTQTISVPYTVSAAGVQALGVQASTGGNVVATGSSTINVLSAAMAPTSASIPVTTSASAQSYGGFTLVNAANSPAMTVQLTASCTGVLSSCVLTSSNASTDSVSLGAGGAPAISIKFVAATVGMGTFTISASSKGVTLGGASLTVTASAPTSNVSVTLDPPQRTVNAVAGSATLTYAGFNLSNDANSPATTIQLDLSCAVVIMCRFSNGTTTMSVGLAVNQIVNVPFSYVAPTGGTGTAQLTARVPGGSVLSTSTLTVNVQGAVAATLTPPNPAVNVSTSSSSQVYNSFVLTNAPGSPAATFNLTTTCVGVSTCRFSNNQQTISYALAANGAQSVPISYVASAVGSGGVSIDVASGGVSLASATLGVTARAPTVAMTLTPTAPTVPQSAGTATLSYSGFTLTNVAGSPSAAADLSVVCTGITVCRFSNGQSTLSTSLAPNAAVSVPINYVASAPGTGTATVRVVSGGVAVAAATLTVTTQATGAGITVVTQGLTTDSLLYRDECVTLSLGADIASECGDLRVVHALPAVRTLNVTRAPVMTYSSAHARVVTTVPAELTLPSNVTLTSIVLASLKLNGAQYASGYWLSSSFTPSTPQRASINVDNFNNGTPSGVYPYTLEVTANTTTGSVITQSSGQFIVVNRAASPFGAGWWVAGLEQLDVNTLSRLVWYGGDGSVRIYNQRAGSVAPSRVWGAASTTYPDSIREGSGTTYIRQLPDSVWVTFNANGQHVTTRNAKGHVTTFTYDGSGRLSQIAAPPGPVGSALTWTFTYNGNGKLATVTAPGDTGTRVVQWNVNASTGRVDSITDPGLPTRTIRFGYGAGSLITSRTNGRGVVTRLQYDSSFHVSRASLIMPADSISRSISNWQSFGLTPTTASPSAVRVTLDGPRVGQQTAFQTNAFGAPTRVMSKISSTDSLVSTVLRGEPRFPALMTQSKTPAGYVTDAGYDERGRLQWLTAPATSGESATTWFTWDTKWDAPLVVTNPEGDFTTFGLDVATGNRLWQQDARGPVSRTTFTYDAATNQVATVITPVNASQSFVYDTLRGNLFIRIDERLQQSYWHTNNIGLDTLTRTPYSTIGSFNGPYELTQIAYSKRNEVLAKGHGASTISDTVRTTYDAEGNALTVTRAWLPNPQAISAQTTTVTYDNADRAVSKCESTGGCESAVFDSAGNARIATTRRTQQITMAYDLVNRLTDRTIPVDNSSPYPAAGSVMPASGPESLPFARTPRPAETQHYTYHPSGQIASATALDADVTRTYHASGALLSETLGIRNRARTATPHTYALTFEYDRNGRRTARTLNPDSLFAGGAMRTYFGSWGAVDSVTDIARNRFEFSYNANGELASTLYPSGVRQTRTYDVFGRDSTDRIARAGSTSWPYFPDTLLRNFNVTARNARGQILLAADAAFFGGAVPSAQYDSIGHLIRSTLRQPGYANISGDTATYFAGDTTSYDGLGNILTARNGWRLGGTTNGAATRYAYGTLTGRLDTLVVESGSPSGLTKYAYDAAGNVRFESTLDAATTTVERASYYGADDRLVATDRRTPGKQLVDEYRYDALGRRVWVSTRWRCAPTSPTCIVNAVTRTMWDGTNEAAEIRAQYDTSTAATEELDAGANLVPKSSFGDANPFYGRVVYGLGLALDQPLSVTRYGYRDNPEAADALAWPTFTLMPFWDYRGTPVFGLYADGTYWKPFGQTTSTHCATTPGAGTTDRCVYLTWPFAGSAYHQDRGLVLTYSWQGSLLQKKRDVSGLTYARNRMYDPQTGRFTQEDPIGLAGGLNAYGFAKADPVNFGDPFGLEGCEKTDKICQIAVATGKRLEQPERILNIYAGVTAAIFGGAALAELLGSGAAAKAIINVPARGASFAASSAAAASATLPFAGFAAWGRELWGRGAAGAIQAAAEMTAERAAAIDLNKVRAALEFYQNATALGRGGLAAPERVALMLRIIELSSK